MLLLRKQDTELSVHWLIAPTNLTLLTIFYQ